MTTLLSRIAVLESRLASQTLWHRSKRRRAEWVCVECKSQTACPRQRAYSDDSSLKLGVGGFLFPDEASRDTRPAKEQSQRFTPFGGNPAVDPSQRRPWGRGAVEDDGDAQELQETAMWETLEKMAEAPELEADAEPGAESIAKALTVTSKADLLDIDYASELPTALMDNNPDLVARCLFSATLRDDLDFIRDIPNTTFSECIRILQPCNFTEPLASAHVEISDAMAKQLNFTSINQVAQHHAQLLNELISIRRSVGNKIGMPEYRMLLRAARDLGDESMARSLWKHLMNDEHTPDVACYNAYMASTVFNGIHKAVARRKIRVIPHFQLLHQKTKPPDMMYNYRVGGKRGLKENIMRIFGDMLRDGVVADAESFRNVIIAAAREGDMATVKSVLRKVWDIDVDALVAGQDESSIGPKPMSKNSPLHPSASVLFAIAHAFGINNEVPTALRVVDFVARNYQISIDQETWAQLYEWTFVLSSPRTGVKAQEDDTKKGELPLQSLLNLWKTMTGPPYHIKPTMGMYNHLIRNLQNRDSTRELYAKMCEGLEISRAHRRHARSAFKRLSKALESEERVYGAAAYDSLQNLRQEWEHADLIRKRNFFWCKRWLRLLLSTLRSYVQVDKSMDWSLREVPQILWEWRAYAPTKVWYDTAGGLVEFNIRTEEEIEENRLRIASIKERREKIRDLIPLFVSDEWVQPRKTRTPRRVVDEESL